MKSLQEFSVFCLQLFWKSTIIPGEDLATHSSVLAWRIPGTEEPGGLPSIGLHRVRHDWNDLACLHALEEEMATHSSILAWRILGMEEPGGLPSIGSNRVRLSSSSSMITNHGRGISGASSTKINEKRNRADHQDYDTSHCMTIKSVTGMAWGQCNQNRCCE